MGYLGLDFNARVRLVHHKAAVRHVNQRSNYRGCELNYWAPVVKTLWPLTSHAAKTKEKKAFLGFFNHAVHSSVIALILTRIFLEYCFLCV